MKRVPLGTPGVKFSTRSKELNKLRSTAERTVTPEADQWVFKSLFAPTVHAEERSLPKDHSIFLFSAEIFALPEHSS